MRENAFLQINDFVAAQELSGKIRVEDLHKVLDILAKRYCPVIEKYGLSYRWSIMQAEYATDIVFRKQADLKPLYDNLVRTAIHSVKPENIATFLGKKLHPNYQGEMGNNFNTRIQGTRIKHQMGATSIKMYDKFGIILRIETSTNDVSEFQHFREVQHRNGAATQKVAPMKKNIYSLFPLAGLLKAANRRYLEFISTFDDPTSGVKNLNKVTQDVEKANRNYKGFNFFNNDDLNLLLALTKGQLNINGIRNQYIRQHLPWSTGKVSRMLKRLRVHGLIKKVGGTYKYYLTKLGKKAITAGLYLKEMFIVPQLANI
jgi:DNA-binding MarR family transcriptional regulator